MAISGEELRDARALAGLTQARLAERLGVSQRTIVSWEASEVPARSERVVIRSLGSELNEVRQMEMHSAWLDSSDGRAYLEESYARNELEAKERIESGNDLTSPVMYGRRQRQIVEAADQLSKFDTMTLLYELLRREYDPTNTTLDLFLSAPTDESPRPEFRGE